MHFELTDDQRQYLKVVKSGAESLLGLINDLLDFSKIEAAKMELEPAPFSLRAVVGDTLRVLAAHIERTLQATPGTRYVDNPVRLRRTDLRVTIDRGKAGLLGVPTLEIDRTLRLGLAGLDAGVLRERDGDARNIVVRLVDATRPDPAR